MTNTAFKEEISTPNDIDLNSSVATADQYLNEFLADIEQAGSSSFSAADDNMIQETLRSQTPESSANIYTESSAISVDMESTADPTYTTDTSEGLEDQVQQAREFDPVREVEIAQEEETSTESGYVQAAEAREIGLITNTEIHQELDQLSTADISIHRKLDRLDAYLDKYKNLQDPKVKHQIMKVFGCVQALENSSTGTVTRRERFMQLLSYEANRKEDEPSILLDKSQGKTTLDYLDDLVDSKLSKKLTDYHKASGRNGATKEEAQLIKQEAQLIKSEMVMDILNGIAAPESTTQGAVKATCDPTTTTIQLQITNPAEYARIGSQLATKLSVTLAGGDKLDAYHNPSGEDIFQEEIVNGIKPRTKIDQLIQASFMKQAAKYYQDRTGKIATYKNSEDRTTVLVDGNRQTQFAGVWPADSQRLASQIFDTNLERQALCTKDSNGNLFTKQDMAEAVKNADGPVKVGLKWNPTGTHIYHSVLVHSIEGDRVNYINPWGRAEHMSLNEFEKRIVTAIIPKAGTAEDTAYQEDVLTTSNYPKADKDGLTIINASINYLQENGVEIDINNPSLSEIMNETETQRNGEINKEKQAQVQAEKENNQKIQVRAFRGVIDLWKDLKERLAA